MNDQEKTTPQNEEQDGEERNRNIDWEKLSLLLSSNTAESLKEFLSKENSLEKTARVEDQPKPSLPNRKYPKDPPNSVFKLKDYWEERFVEEESYEWLVSWSKVKSMILPYLSKDSRILIVGCGNSSFSADIYDEGFENITNIDFSSVVIERMRQLHEPLRPKMKWIEMDMTKLSFPAESFDIVLDKAAMDALVVDEGDVWDPKEDVIEAVDAMCRSVSQVLTTTGICLQISFAQPHFRTKYLIGYRATHEDCSPYESHRGYCSRYGWNLTFAEIPSIETGCLAVFLYEMRKTSI